MKFFKFLITDWFLFIFKPNNKPIELSLKRRIAGFAFYLVFFFLIYYSLENTAHTLLNKLWLIKIIPFPITYRYEILASGFWILVIIGPILEELMFRLSLRAKPYFLAISLTLIFFFCIDAFFDVKIFFNWKYTLENAALMILIAAILTVVINFFRIPFEKFWNKYFVLIFYLSALLFGYMHLNNYFVIHYSVVLLSPVFIFPKIIVGLNFGFLRMRYGIIFSILTHMSFNLVPYLIYLHYMK